MAIVASDTVVELAEQQPHLTVNGPDRVHVVPVSLIRQTISGYTSVASLDPMLVRDILADWLGMVTE